MEADNFARGIVNGSREYLNNLMSRSKPCDIIDKNKELLLLLSSIKKSLDFENHLKRVRKRADNYRNN